MGSVKFKDLKAYVRYDGSGRVVAGSLVFRKKKPKNGRWSEISSNLCCNPGGNTTTTTTTTGGGGTTPTAWVVNLYGTEAYACASIPSVITIVYTESSTLNIGTTLWADAALTIPFNTSDTYYGTFAGDSTIYMISSMSLTFISGMVSCTTSTTTTVAPTYTIGEAALGGIVAYINGGGSTGTSGLVVSAADVSTGAFWGCQDVDISTGSAIGTGYQNTINIVNNCTTPGIAAKLCRDLLDGGFSDWYLPSKDELDALYVNSVAIGITSNIYWTSTQYETNSIGAWFKNFSNGSPSIDVKDTNHYVRAVRSF